jgi:hypothetical protein
LENKSHQINHFLPYPLSLELLVVLRAARVFLYLPDTDALEIIEQKLYTAALTPIIAATIMVTTAPHLILDSVNETHVNIAALHDNAYSMGMSKPCTYNVRHIEQHWSCYG